MQLYRQIVYCGLRTVCKVTVKFPLVADCEFVASLYNVGRIYIEGKSYSQKWNKTERIVVAVEEYNKENMEDI